MDIQADAVAKPVRKIAAISGLFNHLSCSAIHLCCGNTWLCSRFPGEVRAENDLINIGKTIWKSSYCKGSCKICPITTV